jgi:hypothetical protein
MDFWVTLWTILLWASASAFGLIALFILYEFVRRLLGGARIAQ